MPYKICNFCGEPGTKVCERCREYYCSDICQSSDWLRHKLSCIAFPRLVDETTPTFPKSPISSRLDHKVLNVQLTSTKSFSSNMTPLRRPYQNKKHAPNNSNTHTPFTTNKNPEFDVELKNAIGLVERFPNEVNVKTIDCSSLPNTTSKNTEFVVVSKNAPAICGGVPNNIIGNTRESSNTPYTASQNLGLDMEPKTDVAIVDQNVTSSMDPKLNLKTLVNPDLCSKKPWQNAFPFPRNQLVKVIVQYVDKNDNTLVWVMEASLEDTSNKLLKEINTAINPEIRQCTDSEIQIGEVLAALFDDGLYYRAVILEEPTPRGEVRIRLVDYGNEFFVSVNKLKPAIPIMKNLNAYAFCIRFRNHKVEVGDSIEIRIICKDVDVYLIKNNCDVDTDIKSLPRKNVLEDLTGCIAKITFSNIFTSSKAIAYFSNDKITNKLIEMNNSLTTTEQLDKNVLPGDFIAGKTNFGWKRGIVLASNIKEYIMSVCDTGEITLISEIKIIPKEYKQIPIQTIVLQLEKILMSETIFTNEFFVMNKSVLIKFGKELDNNNKLIAELYDEANTPLAKVNVYSWSGTLSELNIKYWPLSLLNNDNVKITSILKNLRICICPADKFNFYSETFHDIGSNAPTLNPSDAKPNNIVLAPNYGRFVRCLITYKPNDCSSNLVDLDSGCQFSSSDDELKLANNFVRHCPVYVLPVNLRLSDKIQSYDEVFAMKTLKTVADNEKIFRVQFSGSYKNGVELFSNDGSQDSLNDLLIPEFNLKQDSVTRRFQDRDGEQVQPIKNIKTPLMEEKLLETSTVQQCIDESNFSFKPVEIIPINTGQNVEIFCLDVSFIHEGVITACNLDIDYLTKLENVYAGNIEKYCNSPEVEKFYRPKVDEMCFSIFNADGRWYRACCIEELPNDNYMLQFLDYGNVTSVTSKDIRKFSKDFFHPCAANICLIDGLRNSSSSEIIEKIKSVVIPNSVVKVDKITKKGDTYILHFNQ